MTKSRQERQKVDRLSSLVGLKKTRPTSIPALKCWAIFECPCRDKNKSARYE